MAPNPNKMAEACKAVDFLGISEAIVKKKLRALLKLYDNNWELIAAEGYRVLADHLLEDNEQEDKPKKRKAALPLQIVLPSELEAPLRTLRPRKKKRGSDSLRKSKETEAKISLRKGKSALPSTSDTSQSSEEIPLIKRRSIHHKEQLSACNNSPAYEEEVAKPDMHAVCSVAPKIDPYLDIIPLEVIPDSDCCYYMDNVTKEAITYEVEDQAGLEATNPEISEKEGDQVSSLPEANPDLGVDIHQALADLAELGSRLDVENALALFFSFLGLGPHSLLSSEKIEGVRAACETLICSPSSTSQAVRLAAQQLLDLIEVKAAEYKESLQKVALQGVQGNTRAATQQIGVVRSHLDRVNVLQTELANLRGRKDSLREELAALEAKIATKDDELRREKTAYKRADAILRQAVEAVTSIGGMNPPPQDRAQERVAAIEEQFNGIRAVVIPVAP